MLGQGRRCGLLCSGRQESSIRGPHVLTSTSWTVTMSLICSVAKINSANPQRTASWLGRLGGATGHSQQEEALA